MALNFLTMKSLADETGINKQTLWQYENFKAYPTARSLKRSTQEKIIDILEKIFKRPIEDLFPEDYKAAIDKKINHSFEIVKEGYLLPEWLTPKALQLPEEILEEKELKEKINETLKSLTEREAKVLKLRFGLDDGIEHTLDEVGARFKVTDNRIMQIEAKALRKLGLSRELKSFTDGY